MDPDRRLLIAAFSTSHGTCLIANRHLTSTVMSLAYPEAIHGTRIGIYALLWYVLFPGALVIFSLNILQKVQHPVFEMVTRLAPAMVSPPISPPSSRPSPHRSLSISSHSSSASYTSSDSDYRPSSEAEQADPYTPTSPPVIDLVGLLPTSPAIATPRPAHRKVQQDSIIDLTLSTPRQPTGFPKRRHSSSSLTRYPKGQSVKPPLKKTKTKRTGGNSSESSGDESIVLLLQPPPSGRTVTTSGVRLGDLFRSLDEAKSILKAAEEARGFVLVTGQTKRRRNGVDVARITLRCQSYRKPVETHSIRIHPSDHRKSKSHKTDCSARVNLCPHPDQPGGWYISTLNLEHNHDPPIPHGGAARKVPTSAHKSTISAFVQEGNFNRQHLRSILRHQHPDDSLELRQISNLINNARRESQAEIEAAGGDINALIRRLEQANQEDVRNNHRIRTSAEGRVVGIWWQTANQHSFLLQYHDILLNDNSYGRNKYGYYLNVGLGIDGCGKSRNAWYALQAREDVASYQWVFQNHLDAVGGTCPEVVATDRDAVLVIAVERLLPLAFHIMCLSHLGGNVHEKLRAILKDDWPAFVDDFWTVYRAVSPTVFDELWTGLLQKYPSAAEYLQQHIYPDREHFAHAWLSVRFTGGIRTTGRVESENRTIKSLTSPNLNFVQLHERLTARAEEQHSNHLISVRDVGTTFYTSCYQPI